jgi:L-lactate dehydrogenase (cytochrome)
MAGVPISLTELARHNQETDAWLAVNGTIWDVTGFVAEHPGGEAIIRKYFGKDASDAYNEVHGPSLISDYFEEEGRRRGELSGQEAQVKLGNARSSSPYSDLPALDQILNLQDFEEIAAKQMSERAWVYISGGSNDCVTMAANTTWYRRILLRPRILRDVSQCDTSRTIFGVKLNLPVLNAPASLVKLAHPDGELALAKGAAAMGTSTVIPTMSSFSAKEIVDAMPVGYPFFFQLYMSPNRSVTEKLLKDVCQYKPRAIIITTDLPVFSKRESNERYEMKMAKESRSAGMEGEARRQARSPAGTISASIRWEDVRWVQEFTGLPVVVKGIQCAADAKLALDYGCHGFYVSNHGGRAADTAAPSILTLLEIRLQYPQIFDQMVVLIDGGIRRGSDVLKAICLGAHAVCIGRPYLYAAMYGQDGVKHAIESKLALSLPLNFARWDTKVY